MPQKNDSSRDARKYQSHTDPEGNDEHDPKRHVSETDRTEKEKQRRGAWYQPADDAKEGDVTSPQFRRADMILALSVFVIAMTMFMVANMSVAVSVFLGSTRECVRHHPGTPDKGRSEGDDHQSRSH